jgi:hypothetical protein
MKFSALQMHDYILLDDFGVRDYLLHRVRNIRIRIARQQRSQPANPMCQTVRIIYANE